MSPLKAHTSAVYFLVLEGRLAKNDKMVKPKQKTVTVILVLMFLPMVFRNVVEQTDLRITIR